MDILHRLLKQLRKDRVKLLSIFGVGLLICGYLALSSVATKDSNLRKSAVALEFESSPEDWLTHPQDASTLKASLDAGDLKTVAITQATRDFRVLVLYTLKNGDRHSAFVPGCSVVSCAGTIVEQLAQKSSDKGFTLVSADVEWRPASSTTLASLTQLAGPLGSLLAIGLLLYVFVLMQSIVGDGAGAAKLSERPAVSFEDVVGAQEAKAALTRVKSFMGDPSSYAALGAMAPRGVLLTGAPGTGKTLLAKALAGECKANFIAVDGSYFTSMFFGMGVLKVKRLFKLARKHAPCVLFIDEMDGVGRRSQGSMQGTESELNRIINRILVEMDGFESNDSIVVVGATNHSENMDPAMLRPGRFDMTVQVQLPTVVEREALFELYTNKVKTIGNIDFKKLSRMTAGMSPAEVANTVNKAAAKAAESAATAVAMEHLLKAIETHQLGGEVNSFKQVLSEGTRKRIAVHEAGHALIAHVTRVGVVERVSIEPRGAALGVTYVSRATEEPLYAQAELVSRLAMMLAGREAELLVFGDVSTGASDDLKKASELAINMVTTLGFSPSFGLLSVAGIPKELLGPDVQAGALSEARLLLERAQATCQDEFCRHGEKLRALSDALLAQDVVSGAVLEGLLGRPAGGGRECVELGAGVAATS